MGVDISTWRVRVGMFIPRTSQKSVITFRAQTRSRSTNHHQAPGPTSHNSLPIPETGISELGSIQQKDHKPHLAQLADKAYSHVVWILFSYILFVSVLPVDSSSEPGPTSSHLPTFLNLDENETSPMQLSYMQLLIILMCGDVEVNPGPRNPGPSNPGPSNPGPSNPGPSNPGPSNPGPPYPGPLNKLTFTQRASKLTTFTVPVEDVIYPEYCCDIDVDFTLKRKDQGYLEQMKDIMQTVCAMLNYAGGVITLNPKTACTDKHRDEWVGKIQEKVELVVQKEVLGCIEIKTKSGHIEIWLQKCWKFITYKLSLYVRRGNGTHDGDISMIIEGVDTKPSVVSKVARVSWNQLKQGDKFPILEGEGMHLEFKCYESACDGTSLMKSIIMDEIRGEPKLIRTLLAFTNTPGGGDAIIGVRENTHGTTVLEGQKLSAADEEIVRRRFDELMIKGLNGEQRIWPSAPNGSKWTTKFYPLRNCPNNDRHILIHIRVNQVAGFVLADEPEAYTMTPEGNIRHVTLAEWEICIKPKSNKSAPELLKLGPQSGEQDNVDDIDDEQFKQLVDDLKSHRVTLSLKHIKTASWTKDSEDSQDDIMPGVNMDTCVEEVSKSDLLKPLCPSTWVPDRTTLDRWVTNNQPDIKECVDAITQSHPQEAVVIGTKCFGRLFPRLSLEVPQHHAFDFAVLRSNAEVDLWIAFENCTDIVTCRKYANSAIRMLRSELLSYIHHHTDTKDVRLAIRAKVWSIADNRIKHETRADYTECTVRLPVLQKAVAYCLLQGQSHIKNRLGEEYLTTLTKDQLLAYLHCDYMPVIVFQGPPGSGKSIIAQHLCEQHAQKHNLSKDNILYICPHQPLAEFIKFQQKCEVKFTTSDELVCTIREALENGILLIIIDDAHLFQCSKEEWIELLNQFILQKSQGSTERHLAVFLDPVYQNFLDDRTQNLFDAISACNAARPFCQTHVCKALPIMIRNSRDIFAFFKTNAEEGSSTLMCSHDFRGDGVSVTYTLEDFFQGASDNPIIKVAQETVGLYNFEENFTYQVTDITILVDVDGRGNAEQPVQDLYEIFSQFYPEAKIQRASQFPVKGIVIEELKSFSGLDTRVCILVLTCKNTSVMDEPRYKCFVASRGITKLVFLLHGDTAESSFKQLKFSEEKQWQKLTKQLLKEIPDKGSSEEWLRTNVPDTECWYKTKPFVIVRCQQLIKSDDFEALADLGRSIPPVWRQDAQFVRTMIRYVCEKTIGSESSSDPGIESRRLRTFLAALNSLYGAPVKLQHQALDSVYDLVESFKRPENFLQNVLEMMWHDGYISRQAMLSWFDNMDQTKRQTCEIKLQGKDLGEKMQERMRTRQEVWEWMADATQLNAFWDDCSHYQRVAFHALCQLAVTWQGDKCTVDKDLLFHYIPQLFCHTRDGLQLLYAVQCVLHQLHNPPGLAVAVLQAVLTISRLDTEDSDTEYTYIGDLYGADVLTISKIDTGVERLKTTTDWKEWINTQNPAYAEGRNIVQQLGQILDLIILASSEVTLTEINDWISENIPQNQMLDAFIIAAVCLMNRGEEVTLIRDWISQNVPQSMGIVIQDTWKTIIIQRCVQNILHTMEPMELADWTDRHILPAWRRDPQFVGVVIKAVCERTMNLDHEIESVMKVLRIYLGSLNCLYGAPEALQLQALDSVYDHVRTLHNPENDLKEVLNMIWFDGYINKPVILKWISNMDKTCSFQEIQDLREQIQERMRERQEVKWWMHFTAPIGPHHDTYYISACWYELPHYQRVTLHALCQLAVTWQGDKCTVDKDLLFHYIPQLFRHTSDGLQLIYAVQCVLHHLQNPPGLAVAVFQALLTSPDTGYQPVITTTDWEKWRRKQSASYAEGSHIIQGQILDLIELVSSEVTLTEINGWICENIQEDQNDAFIIAAVCLLNQWEADVLIRNWISQHVTQSMKNIAQDTWKSIIIQRCVYKIQSRHFMELVEWLDRHTLPAWRQHAQFVRAAITAVCEETIHSDEIDSKKLRIYIGSLNCLYGAPESLQHQALDSVHNHVKTLQHPEKVLKEVLDIMWYDGYISKQVMLSWLDNIEQLNVIKIQEMLMENKQDLREEIKERLRTRRAINKWMTSTMQFSQYFDSDRSPVWCDLPYYQRVALHALCQLAVTWQGDKCTVDKDLLFHYIPQLFCDTRDGLQLLYAVQCVLYHLQNPPGLAVAVLQALLTISRPDTVYKPLITNTDWDRWRNTQNPVYEEGRNIIEPLGPFLDLIDLVNSKATLTEINGWMSENIPQNEMRDAFIIAAECLLNRGEEMTMIRDWISHNVPKHMQTAVQDTLKTIIIQRCVQTSWMDRHILSWVDRHIPPAWRQDAQFVKVAIKAVCERNIKKKSLVEYKINIERLRWNLGSLNCLYGAPEALQLQALDSVYGHVRTLQHPEKVLQEVLDIIWSDGYISKQTIQSWLGNMDQTSAIKSQGILTGNKKNLADQIQERMRVRQEVRRWMGDTTQMGYYWDDLPHYQRVALHALCQLAVTWQGDKCTVDRDLLFHYIPQFHYQQNELKLLYAVQCVLHHLQNPPGLAVVFIQAVLTIRNTPVNTINEWRNTQNPAYTEGRYIIEQLEHFLDLIVLVSGEVTLTEINDWICGNIPQDQMLDAFIIATVYLFNQGEELALIWVSQNVPQGIRDVVQDIMKTSIIPRRLQNILLINHEQLAAFVDRHILPAWRRDAQFVRAAIKAMCKKTIMNNSRSDYECGVGFNDLRFCLGALNCLYGATDSHQLQALDAVYDHVRTLQDPENILQQVLDIMWFDGYISKQTIQSWCDNLEQSTASKFKVMNTVSTTKDLEEQIQERMEAREEVTEWMQSIMRKRPYFHHYKAARYNSPERFGLIDWYNSPHYQRVALHALCQLAVTWQGDTCTVDRDLLFLYIPQLFGEVKMKLELLYAVQSVVYVLGNPPELTKSVLQALVTSTADQPIITESQLEEWRKTEHPVYEEGRETMLITE